MLGIFGVVSGAITIYLVLRSYNGLKLTILILGLVIITLIVYLTIIFSRLRKAINLYNIQSKKLHEANDNRNTLKKMVEEKNNEIDAHRNDLATLKAQGVLMFSLLYASEKPEQSIVKQALRIESDGVIKSEK